MPISPIQSGEAFGPDQTRQILDAFYRDGFVHVPGVLTSDETKALLEKTNTLINDPLLAARVNPERSDQRCVQSHKSEAGQEMPFILRNTIELDPLFPEMLVRQPILGLAEAVVGDNCKFCGQNVIRNLPGIAIERWHVDGTLHFPVHNDIPRHDPRMRPPVLWFTVQIALTDVDRIEHGPTQYVPGSHFSGRQPNDQENPQFEGQGPVSIYCKAGDIYLQDPQCWHRGAPNTSERTRYLMQSQYAIEWAYRRFGWMNRVPVADEYLRTADDCLLNVLGCRRPEAQP